MRIIVNGRLVEVKDGATAAEVKGAAGIPASESLVEVSGSSAKQRAESEPLRADGRYRSIPPVQQGAVAELARRVKEEVELLRREVGGAGIVAGRIKVGGLTYVGVIVSGLRVEPGRFSGAKDVNAMILVPPDYPRLAPLGLYLSQPHRVKLDSAGAGQNHFIGRGVHGAPTLEAQGWYWYCHALGGFDGAGARHWRPAPKPADGHNLATVMAAARVSLHQDR